jgi:hypothetical protein
LLLLTETIPEYYIILVGTVSVIPIKVIGILEVDN